MAVLSPDEHMRRAPKVNRIGELPTGPEFQLTPKGDNARSAYKTVKVWREDGLCEEHVMPNARDLVSFGTIKDEKAGTRWKWSLMGFGNSPATKVESSSDGDEPVNEAANVPEEVVDVMAPINERRAEIQKLGGEFDKRWGLKRLDEELVILKASLKV